MNSIYTTTLTEAASNRGIAVKVIDSETPVFEFRFRNKKIRCYNGLTDRVGAVSFILANSKILANRFLAMHGFNVPAQIKHTTHEQAMAFLKKWRSVVIKPASEWGARGVSVAVGSESELKAGLRRAHRFGEEVLLEQFVDGVDKRLIYVDQKFTAAIMRSPACIVGNGSDTLRALVKTQNRQTTSLDPSHKIPLDSETARNLAVSGYTLESVPAAGKKVRVRLTSNYHTGGDCVEITGSVEKELVREGRKVAQLFDIPLLGIDFLVKSETKKYWIIETSPDMAISPPEGDKVANALLDSLFPETS